MRIFSAPAAALFVVSLAVLAQPPRVLAQPDTPPTAFTYQGHLTNPAGAPLSGAYDLRFRLFESTAPGGPDLNAPLGTVTHDNVAVNGGLFTVELDFGKTFPSYSSPWLEVAVRPAGAGAYEALAPLQRLAAAPFALSLRLPYDGSHTTMNGKQPIHTLSNNGIGLVSLITGYGKRLLEIRREPLVLPPEPELNPEQFAATGGGESFAAKSPAVGERPLRTADPVPPAPMDTVASENSGLYGYARSGGYGVYGHTGGLGFAVYGKAENYSGSYAGYFDGSVHVQGGFTATGAKSFRIDHPLDPEHRDLVHAAIESDEMLNVYRGTVILDRDGRATVVLPRWFEALNRDVGYQLTPVGGAAPALHVAKEIDGGRFEIAGGTPGLKVCWLVTGVRDDAYAREHPLVVEPAKAVRLQARATAPGGGR